MKTCGAIATTPRTAWPAPAWISAIEAPSEWPISTGLSTLSTSNRAGRARRASSCMKRPLRFMHDEALRALPALLEVLGVENPVLIGHSDGASIALIHAGAG